MDDKQRDLLQNALTTIIEMVGRSNVYGEMDGDADWILPELQSEVETGIFKSEMGQIIVDTLKSIADLAHQTAMLPASLRGNLDLDDRRAEFWRDIINTIESDTAQKDN